MGRNLNWGICAAAVLVALGCALWSVPMTISAYAAICIVAIVRTAALDSRLPTTRYGRGKTRREYGGRNVRKIFDISAKS